MPSLISTVSHPAICALVFSLAVIAPSVQTFGQSTIRIIAAGTTGDERIELSVNGVFARSWSNLGSGANQGSFVTRTYNSSETVSADGIRVEFTNDLSVNGVDRNVRVDAIEVDGVRYETESSDVFSTATYTPGGLEAGFGRGEFLHANGYFQYSGRVVLQSGTESVVQANASDWFSVDFENEMEDPIVVMSPPTFAGSDPVHTRVRNVTPNGFEYQLEEWAYLAPGIHGAREQVSWIAVERGTHVLSDGAIIEAGRLDIDDDTFDIDFSADFPAAPSVIGQVADEAGAHEVTHRIDNVTASGFDAFLQEEEGRDGNHALEDFHWVAFRRGTFDGYASARISADERDADASLQTGYDGVVLADMQTANGLDTSQLRIVNQTNTSLTLFVEEERSQDNEIGHIFETVSWVRTNSVVTAAERRLVAEQFATGFTRPIEVEFLSDGRFLVAEQQGIVRVVNANGNITGTMLDIRSIVNSTNDRGLLGFAVHPDFEDNGLIYAAYTYDPPQTAGRNGNAGADGRGARVARISRFTANNTRTFANPNTEVILVGRNSTFENIGDIGVRSGAGDLHACVDDNGNPIGDCIPADELSHTVGEIEFGPDGFLYIASGDGGSFTRAELNNLRAQDIDSLAGKILRIDPITGDGAATNPFAGNNLTDNRSKVFALGCRNPFRFAFGENANETRLYIGDVGWRTWEEMNLAFGGENFGWPGYEGGEGNQSFEEENYRNLAEVQDLYATNPVVTAPTWSRAHLGGTDAIVMGDFASGRYGIFGGALIHTDIGDQYLRVARVALSGEVTDVEIVSEEAQGRIVEMETNPNDGYLYYVDVDGRIGRIVLD